EVTPPQPTTGATALPAHQTSIPGATPGPLDQSAPIPTATAAPLTQPTPITRATAAPVRPPTSTTRAIPTTAAGPDEVWVNTETHVYHKAGSRYYGKTKQGKYMSEQDAISEGNRPARVWLPAQGQ